jgi:hypothetical protein
MSSVQPVFAVLAMLLGVAGFSLSVSASAIPRLPRFRFARRRVATVAGFCLAASLALISWLVRA